VFQAVLMAYAAEHSNTFGGLWIDREAQGTVVLAEVDGNRTRRTRITRPNRFEGGGAHQVPGHLHGSP
jgi:hypothetical protein